MRRSEKTKPKIECEKSIRARMCDELDETKITVMDLPMEFKVNWLKVCANFRYEKTLNFPFFTFATFVTSFPSLFRLFCMFKRIYLDTAHPEEFFLFLSMVNFESLKCWTGKWITVRKTDDILVQTFQHFSPYRILHVHFSHLVRSDCNIIKQRFSAFLITIQLSCYCVSTSHVPNNEK